MLLKELPFNLRIFKILALVITLLCGVIFGVSHQIYRSIANDPQTQLSEDMANYLSSGKEVMDVMPKLDVDIAKNSVWFLSIYKESGEVLASNAKLEGQTPVLPNGVLENAKQKGQNRVTWEPAAGVRIAAVVTPYNGGYVLAGRSLREIDSRIVMMGKMIGLGWAVSLIVTFAGCWFLLPKKLH
jgi:hypothetical protein